MKDTVAAHLSAHQIQYYIRLVQCQVLLDLYRAGKLNQALR